VPSKPAEAPSFIGFAKVFFMLSGAAQKLLLGRFVGPDVYGQFQRRQQRRLHRQTNTIVQGTIQSVSKFTAEDDTRVQPVKRAGLVVQSFLATAIGLVMLFGRR